MFLSSFVGSTIVVRAVREIPAGAQIYTCYGEQQKFLANLAYFCQFVLIQVRMLAEC